MLGRVRTLLARRWRRAGAHHDLGARGEMLAERYLRRRGLRVLARNARTPVGEADLVLEERSSGMIVIAEVKTRRASGDALRPPERSVGAAKRRTLLAIAAHLRERNGWLDRPIRIDIVAVEIEGSEFRVRHFPDAVRG